MIVIEMNKGLKIPYEESGNLIIFDDDLSINLAKREQDEVVQIDVCLSSDRSLVIGAAAGRSYIAQIEIPAREYVIKGEGEDEKRLPVPFDMEKVKLQLFAMNI